MGSVFSFKLKSLYWNFFHAQADHYKNNNSTIFSFFSINCKWVQKIKKTDFIQINFTFYHPNSGFTGFWRNTWVPYCICITMLNLWISSRWRIKLCSWTRVSVFDTYSTPITPWKKIQIYYGRYHRLFLVPSVDLDAFSTLRN